MTEPQDQKRFRRIEPRENDTPESRTTDRANFLDVLDEIEHALTLAVPPDTKHIERRSAAYYTACMILIRLASLFEEEGFQTFVSPVTLTERRAIATMRNIAAHAGYREMDDVTLWRTLTTDVPELLTRLRDSGTT